MLVNIGFVASRLGMNQKYIHRHEELLGLRSVRTSGGHRRYELEEVKMVANKLAAQRMSEAHRMLNI